MILPGPVGGLIDVAGRAIGDTEVRSMLPLYGPKALDEAIVAKVNRAVRAAQADPDTRKRLAAAYSPAEAATALVAEHERVGTLIKQLGIKADGAWRYRKASRVSVWRSRARAADTSMACATSCSSVSMLVGSGTAWPLA